MKIIECKFCKRCKICDKPIRRTNKSGYCSNCGGDVRRKIKDDRLN